jgi:hypothetical protein
MAEGVGFEPTRACALPVFKTGAINHSTTPPACPRRGNCAIVVLRSKVDRALRRSMLNVAAEPHFFLASPAERPIHLIGSTAIYVHVNLSDA